MRRTLLACALCLSIVPAAAFSQSSPISRFDGFLLIWQGIKRPAEKPRKQQFDDVDPSRAGADIVGYAKTRGILDDGKNFHPDAPLTTHAALLMLFRTRNVDPVDAITDDHLPQLLARYPLAVGQKRSGSGMVIPDAPVTQDRLQEWIGTLDSLLKTELHEISFYGEDFQGQNTAFDEKFDMHAMTAAHKLLPYNTMVKVTNADNGKSVTVRINDRGPFVPGRDMDLSLDAFLLIAPDRSVGKLKHVTFERLGDASMVGPCSRQPQEQLHVAGTVHLIGGVPSVLHLGDSVTLRGNKEFSLRDVVNPDGSVISMRKWIKPGDQYAFTPASEGTYTLHLSVDDGRARAMGMEVVKCGS